MQLFLRKIGILEHGLKLSTAERQNAETATEEKRAGDHAESAYRKCIFS